MKLSLNLASRSYLNRRALYGCYGILLTVLTLLLVLNLTFYLRSRGQARQLEARLAELDRDFPGQRLDGALNPAAYQGLLEEIGFANEILVKDGFRWTELLDRLEEVVPGKVMIRGIQPDYKEGSLRLFGQARRVRDLRQFLDNLIRSPHFGDVYLLQQEREEDRAGRQEGVGFTIVVKGAF